jgi:hypothetical protein
MSASKLNPNVWKGEERDGGYIAKNGKPTSASSPHWRGKIYLKGIGWYWISGWNQGGEGNGFIALRAQEMTDEQARKFCAPKEAKRGTSSAARPPSNYTQNGAGPPDEIPF